MDQIEALGGELLGGEVHGGFDFLPLERTAIAGGVDAFEKKARLNHQRPLTTLRTTLPKRDAAVMPELAITDQGECGCGLCEGL
ncbi:hypothetical protein [Halomonas getboli]|uniref:hypothetical protein n=1 Tax=Halomonas getboli TaxID=2935862 RepID=UPI001FFF7C3B|nr:hypothetical protein [Halomonas getboli]MCK2183641.1 hypothetical protein [Halomonas getboli]